MKHKKLAVLVLHVYLKQGNINIIVFETALKIPRALRVSKHTGSDIKRKPSISSNTIQYIFVAVQTI